MAENEAKKKARPLNEVAVQALVETTPGSKALEKDEFSGLYGGDGGIIEPLYNPEQLIRLPEQSDILQQCIDAMSTNIVGFGYDLEYDEDYDKVDPQRKKQLDTAWETYRRWLDGCNFDTNFTEIMSKAINDRERLGWFALEVLEDSTGRAAGLEHIPAQNIRMTVRDKTPQWITVHTLDEKGNVIEHTYAKRFRRFVQIINGKKVYFKEFGDPRTLNCVTGEFREDTPAEDRATSIIFDCIYCPYTPYGLPRYMGQLLNCLGSRKAEELNFTYFKEGRHMPMALIVENGKLTEDSRKNLMETKGDLSRHKVLLLEGVGFEKQMSLQDDDAESPVHIRIEPLAQMLQGDGLFQKYCENNRGKIRSAFRLHPIYTGESQDYTRATADTARRVTEEQVFNPERTSLAFRLNSLLKKELGVDGVSLIFKAPELTDSGDIATALTTFIEGGAVTPNMLLEPLGKLLGRSLEPFKGEWADKPVRFITADDFGDGEDDEVQRLGALVNEAQQAISGKSEDDAETVEKSDDGIKESLYHLAAVIKGAVDSDAK